MKVSKIYIKDYNQFKEFTLDLTYPAGHEKAGQPLDKICFIGQSGTGKTSLLLFLKNLWEFLIQADVFLEDNLLVKKYADSLLNEFSVVFQDRNYKSINLFQNENYSVLEHIGPLRKKLRLENPNILYFSTEVELQTWGANIQLPLSNFWNHIVDKIKTYQELEIQKRIEFSKVIEDSNSQELFQKAKDDFATWKDRNPNPLENIADQLLDKVLNRFNLRVKKELNFTNKDDIGSIKIETLQGQEVPFNGWSTGTKQLIMRVLPLYAMRPKNYLILFDEPEQSLYPDIQTEIIDLLTSKELSTDCQFFFATHSPLIASSFEPWEIVELKFNDEGSVYRELYYEGENHVDNYTINPQLLRWDGILQRVFDLDKASNPKRNEALSQLAKLKKTLERNTLTAEERAVKWKEYTDLAEKLNWEIEELDKPETNAKN